MKRKSTFKNQSKKEGWGVSKILKKSWEAPVNSDETYGRPRPAPWPGALLRWAAAPAANPQSWTCLDATRHVDSLRQERKKVGGVLLFCYTPIIHGCLGQGPLVWSQSSWPQQKTPYCLHSLSTGVFIWEPEELGGAGDQTEWGRTLITQMLPLTFREDKNGPLLQRKKERKKNERKEKSAGPSLHNATAEGLEERRGDQARGNLILKSIGGSEEDLLLQQSGFSVRFYSGSGLQPDSLWFQLNSSPLLLDFTVQANVSIVKFWCVHVPQFDIVVLVLQSVWMVLTVRV